MSKLLNVDEMLEAATLSNMPGAADLVALVEDFATELAARLGDHLGVDVGDAHHEPMAFGGTCAAFYAKHGNHVCPEALRDLDASEWNTRDGDEAPREDDELVEF
jgi:hypothetical protein